MRKIIFIGLALSLSILITACSANNENVPVESEPSVDTSQAAPSLPPQEMPTAPLTSTDELTTEPLDEPNPEPGPASADEPTTEERIDIQYLLGTGDTVPLFDEVRHIFGELIEYGEIQMSIPHYFENGLTAHPLNVGDEPSPLTIISVDYGRASNPTFYHFNGIDGTSSYDDVIALFGQPDNIRTGTDEELRGALVSYGYWVIDASRFVRFFFDDSDNVVGIFFSIPN